MPTDPTPPSDYHAEVEAWRADMDAQMRAPGPPGWLAIVGMYPLKDGRNRIGAAPDSDVRLPAHGSPDEVAIVDFDGVHGRLAVTTDETVTVDGEPVREATLRNMYEPGGMSVVRVRDVSFGIMQWGSDPYNIRVWDADSPKRLNFGGRAWFPIDPKVRVQGRFHPLERFEALTVTHTGGDPQVLTKVGTVAFSLNGHDFAFEAASSELGRDHVWLLMRDGTSGSSTYGAGRFMQAPLTGDGGVDIDFNKFYQPPCAFCDYTTCPMPPLGNVLPFPVEAGERFPTP